MKRSSRLHRRVRRLSAQKGFNLIELAISLVVVVMGVMGMLGLQLQSSRLLQGSQYRGKALALTQYVTERMEANKGGAAVGLYQSAPGEANASPLDCSTSSCAAADMAAYDLAQWRTQVQSSLPGGSGSIVLLSNAGSPITRYQIQIQWSEVRTLQRNTASSATETFSVTATKAIL